MALFFFMKIKKNAGPERDYAVWLCVPVSGNNGVPAAGYSSGEAIKAIKVKS